MKTIVTLSLLVIATLLVAATPAERPNTVLIRPGDVLYVRFDESGTNLKLLSTSAQQDDSAQLVISMKKFDRQLGMLTLIVESRFKKTLHYKAEMRLLSRNRRQETSVVAVMAGLKSFETWTHPIDELALYGFELKE